MSSHTRYRVSNGNSSRTKQTSNYGDTLLTSVIYIHGHYHERGDGVIDSPSSTTELQTPQAVSGSERGGDEDRDVDTICGCGPFKPKSMQKYSNPKWYLAVMSVCAIVQGE